MGGGLLGERVFVEHVRAVGEALGPFVDFDLLDVLGGSGGLGEGVLGRVEVVQPALFAVSTGLACVWESWGVVPDAVVGHSQGEIAAAYVAGVLSLEDAARLVAVRSRVIGEFAPEGAMAHVALPVEVVRAELGSQAGLAGRVEVAAVNGPGSTIVSGDRVCVEGLVAGFGGRGVRARVLPVSYASHCAHMDVLGSRVDEAVGRVSPGSARVPFYSTVVGGVVAGEELGGGYWQRNLRSPVRFAETVEGLLDAGFRRFVEVSAHPVLTSA
ncbi:acyltransferase domain-containing protein, partial [Streptomyces reniochalinae]